MMGPYGMFFPNLIVFCQESKSLAAPPSEVQPLQVGDVDEDRAKLGHDGPVKVVAKTQGLEETVEGDVSIKLELLDF